MRDAEVRGLGLRITAGGAKSFVFYARIRGYPRRLTIGRWPDLTVILARKNALDIRARIARGEDPAADSAAARAEPTFGAFTTTYFERHARAHKRARSVAEDENNLRRYVLRAGRAGVYRPSPARSLQGCTPGSARPTAITRPTGCWRFCVRCSASLALGN